MEGSRTTALCDIRLRLWRKAAMHTWFCVHVMLVQKVSRCMQRLHLQVILLLCLESAILLPLNYIRATGAHKPRQNGEPRQPRHLDTSTASTPTSTPRRHPHMESALTDLDRPRHKPRHRLDRGSTASTPRQPGLCSEPRLHPTGMLRPGTHAGPTRSARPRPSLGVREFGPTPIYRICLSFTPAAHATPRTRA